MVRRRLQTKKQKRKVAKKRKSLKRKSLKNRSYKQKGGALHIESVSKENEEKAIVTVRPDSREPDSMPMTGRLSVMQDILERI
jgi:hypothetical protein